MNTSIIENTDQAMQTVTGPTFNEPSAIEALTTDVQNLSQCLRSYQQQLFTSLAESEKSSALGGVRISLTTMAIFGMVALFTLLVNGLLIQMRASETQLLQANFAIGILYVLVSISVLNDLARGRTEWRNERESLQLRTQDVAEQFRELVKTRQTWVEDATRSQWSSETERLKLQLVQQEIVGRQEALQRCIDKQEATALELASIETRLAEVSSELADGNERLLHEQQLCTAARDEHNQLEASSQALRDEAHEIQSATVDLQHQLTESQSSLAAIQEECQQFIAERVRLVSERAECQARVNQLQQLAAELEQANDSQLQSATTERQSELYSLLQEISINESVLLEQVEKLQSIESGVVQSQEQLAELDSTIIARQQELSHVEGSLTEQNAKALQTTEELLVLACELTGLRCKRDDVQQQLATEQGERAQLQSQIAKATQELVDTECQKIAVEEQLAQRSAKLLECTANGLSLASEIADQEARLIQLKSNAESEQQSLSLVDDRIALQESTLSDLRAQEETIHARVDWLLGQMGELERLSAAQLVSSQVSEEQIELLQQQQVIAEQRLHQITADVELAEMRLSDAEQKVAESHALCESLQASAEAAQARQLAMEELAGVAEQRANMLLNKADGMADQIERRATELSQAKQDLAELHHEIRNLESVKALYDNLSSDSDALDRRMEQQHVLAVELAEQIDSRSQRSVALQLHNEQLEQQALALADQVCDLENQRVIHQQRLDSLQVDIAEMLDTQSHLEGQVHHANDRLNDAKSTVQTLEETMAVYQLDLQRLTADVGDLQVERQSLEAEIASRRTENDSLLHAAQQASELRDQALDDVNALHVQLDRVRQVRAEAESETTRLESQHRALTSRLSELTSEVQEAQSIAAQWKDYLDKVTAQRSRLEAEYHQLKIAHDESDQRLLGKQQAIDSLSQQHDDLSQQIVEQQRVTRANEAMLQTLHNSLHQEQSQRDIVRYDLQQAQAALDDCLSQHSTVESKVRESERLVSHEQKLLEALEIEQREAENKLAHLDDNIAGLRVELERLSDSNSDLAQQSRELSDQISDRAVELQRLEVSRLAEENSFERAQHDHAFKLERLAQTELAIAERSTELQNLIANCETAKAERLMLDQRARALEEQINQLHELSQSQQAEVERTTHDVACAEARVEQLTSDSHQLARQIAELEFNAADKQQQLDVLSEQIEQLTQEHKRMVRKTKRDSEVLKELLESDKVAKIELQAVQGELDSARNHLKQNQVRLADLRLEQSELESTISCQSLESAKMEQQLQELMATVATMQRHFDATKAAKLAIDKSLSGLTTQRDALIQELATLELERVRAQELRAQLSVDQATLEETRGRLESLCDHEVTLTTQLATMQRDLAEVLAAKEVADRELAEAERRLVEVTEALPVEESPVLEVASAIPQAIIETPTLRRTDIPTQEDDIWSTVQSLSSLSQAALPSRPAIRQPDPWSTVQ